MTMTDLERELRATLIGAAEQAPVVDDLAGRATRPIRRRRTGLAAGLAVLSMAAAGVVIAWVAPAEKDAPVAPVTGPAASVALIGTWNPVDIPGFGGNSRLPYTPRPGGRAPTITFGTDGRWRGSDGCNSVHGRYEAGDDGSIEASVGPITLIGCLNVPHVIVLGESARFVIDGRSLVFYAADGHWLGTYQRS